MANENKHDLDDLKQQKENYKKLLHDDDLQDFALRFEGEIVKPLLSAGFERNKYNVFDILNIGRQELRHSDFLAFLMNPNRSGEVGQHFLRNFLALLSKENPALHLDFFKVFYGEFEKVIVRREYQKIDILVEIEIQNEQYVFAIENKVDADEQMYDDGNDKSQLGKYKKAIDTEYNEHKRIYLFLSPNKRPPSESDWTPIDYNLIYSALCRLDLNTADNTVKILINDYKKMIMSQFEIEDNKELTKEALRIYSENKDIFDFIFDCRPNRVNKTAGIIREFLEKESSWIVFENKRQNTYITFTTKKLKELGLDIKFQIDVKNMILYFYIVDGHELREKLGKTAKGKSMTFESLNLLDKKKKKNDETIEKHEKLLLDNNEKKLQTEIEKMLEKIFADKGFVAEWSKEIAGKLKETI